MVCINLRFFSNHLLNDAEMAVHAKNQPYLFLFRVFYLVMWSDSHKVTVCAIYINVNYASYAFVKLCAAWWSEEFAEGLNHLGNSSSVSFQHHLSTFLVGGSLLSWVLGLRPHFEYWEWHKLENPWGSLACKWAVSTYYCCDKQASLNGCVFTTQL